MLAFILWALGIWALIHFVLGNLVFGVIYLFIELDRPFSFGNWLWTITFWPTLFRGLFV